MIFLSNKNKRINKSLLFYSLIVLVISCKTTQAVNNELTANFKTESMDTLEQNIKKNFYPERETPFEIRKFDTFMNGKWIGNAISYGCYREGQAPGVKGPSESEILEDLQIIVNHWNMIRVYGSNEDSERILHVIRKSNLPIKVMLGMWLENETKTHQRKHENIEQVLTAIRLANEYPEIISAINVGNETQVYWSAHRMEIKNLIKYIRYVRNNTNVPVTTADDYNFWNKPESENVADEIDFVVCHIYPLWNGITLENSISWMNDIYFNDIQEFHNDKDIVLGEIGWATKYNPDKKGPGEQGSLVNGEASLNAQEKFLIELNKWIKKNQVTTFLFEAFDEPWKGGGESSGPDEIEKNWGVFYENRTPKESFLNYLKISKLEQY